MRQCLPLPYERLPQFLNEEMRDRPRDCGHRMIEPFSRRRRGMVALEWTQHMTRNSELFDKVEAFQNLLISYATGGRVDEREFKQARIELVEMFGDKLPRFVRVGRDLKQLWPHFKKVSDTYAGRREHIYTEFEELLSELEGRTVAPGDKRVTEALATLSSDAVHAAWQTALERRAADPDGAITSARTLLETVCKHILDDLEVSYDGDADLPALYKTTASSLRLAPNAKTEPVLRQILQGCMTMVVGVGSLRNKLGDAHGRGKDDAKPEARHAELAVNIAGAAAMFLVQSW